MNNSTQGGPSVDHTQDIKHLSLCAGYGGIDLGIKRALGSVRSICYVEIEAFPLANLVSKIEDGLLDSAPLFTDLKRLDWSLFAGRVDLLSGGFPCQPFSQAGRRAGDEDPRHLFPYILEGIRVLRPPFVFLENVSGILTAKLRGEGWRDPEGTPVLLHVCRELERVGLKVEAGVFTASEVGAPHKRERVFILGRCPHLSPESLDFIDGLLRDTEGAPRTAYPRGKGESSFSWEPPRVSVGFAPELVDSDSERLQGSLFGGVTGEDLEDLPPRSSEALDDDLNSGSLRREAEGTDEPEERRDSEVRSAPETSPPPRELHSPFESSLGRGSHGGPDRMDPSVLFETLESRTDELRALGNGVVPDVAERAFRVLWGKLRR